MLWSLMGHLNDCRSKAAPRNPAGLETVTEHLIWLNRPPHGRAIVPTCVKGPRQKGEGHENAEAGAYRLCDWQSVARRRNPGAIAAPGLRPTGARQLRGGHRADHEGLVRLLPSARGAGF